MEYVSHGKQAAVEQLLAHNPSLAQAFGKLRDPSKRQFVHITGFQYALWALDTHLWQAIATSLSEDDIAEQVQTLNSGLWVKQHESSAAYLFDSLIEALKKTLDYCEKKEYSKANATWKTEVRHAQQLIPQHVVNEYCHPTRSFSPTPSFIENNLPRTELTSDGSWYHTRNSVAFLRGTFPNPKESFEKMDGPTRKQNLKADIVALTQLKEVREAQKQEFIASIKATGKRQKRSLT